MSEQDEGKKQIIATVADTMANAIMQHVRERASKNVMIMQLKI